MSSSSVTAIRGSASDNDGSRSFGGAVELVFADIFVRQSLYSALALTQAGNISESGDNLRHVTQEIEVDSFPPDPTHVDL
jgi:hypothetical protein